MERQERRSRIILFFAFLITLVCLGLIGGAFGSDFWVTSGVVQNSLDNRASDTGYAHHGLFKGEASWKSLLVKMDNNIAINCTAATRICRYDAINKDGRPTIVIPTNEEDWNLQDFCSSAMPSATGIFAKPAEINFWAWIAIVVFLSLALLFALVAAVFTMINVLYVPISDIAGIRGIYVWNVAAGVCTLVALLIWVGLYYTRFVYNVLPPWNRFRYSLTTCGLASHGPAVWMLVAAIVLFLLNILLIRLRRRSRITIRRSSVHVRNYNGKGHSETLY
ncbi:hypothetical protein RvY_04897 [Ramazzottius varieornatus]|uniref:Uncharacterized protein n=1 Tax=Ramazzottius varieornatus TaxID=947166 RepID=A0A1D1V2C3_RAMVA|nr:hypothetical protein RvY_04897 [Ramazzottius varieornatus]